MKISYVKKAMSSMLIGTALLLSANAFAFVAVRYTLPKSDATQVTYPIKFFKAQQKKK